MAREESGIAILEEVIRVFAVTSMDSPEKRKDGLSHFRELNRDGLLISTWVELTRIRHLLMILSITKLLFLFVLLFFQFDSTGAHISSNSLSSQPKRYEKNSKWCKGPIDGDCNPYNCGGGCESKYIRFYDKAFKMDRTIKSCFCQQERLCSILGMHAFSGCKSYYQLSSVAQKFVRYWSMDRRDHKNRHSNSVRHRYSDKARHFQLLNGNSRFCCRATTQKRLALHLRSSGPSTNFYFFSSLIAVIYFLIY